MGATPHSGINSLQSRHERNGVLILATLYTNLKLLSMKTRHKRVTGCVIPLIYRAVNMKTGRRLILQGHGGSHRILSWVTALGRSSEEDTKQGDNSSEDVCDPGNEIGRPGLQAHAQLHSRFEGRREVTPWLIRRMENA
eukprot:XP_017455006.1 PREDICTED: uncharacterized protein LOC102549500 isoform X2 [Rattus norvegicus]